MINKNSRLVIGIATLFELTLIVTAIVNILSKKWKFIGLSLIAMICILIPFLIIRIANKKKISLPSSFQLISLAFIFLSQYLGEIIGFYYMFWWWDLLLHAIFGSYMVILSLHLIKGIIRKREEITNARFVLFTVIFAFSISITLGTLWEMFEFVGDYLFKTTMVKGGLEDTSMDLMAKILAALVTSIIYYRSNKNILNN